MTESITIIEDIAENSAASYREVLSFGPEQEAPAATPEVQVANVADAPAPDTSVIAQMPADLIGEPETEEAPAPVNGEEAKKDAPVVAKLDAIEKEVFEHDGEPFIVDAETGKVELNERTIARAFTTIHQVKYAAERKEFSRYEPTTGLWQTVDANALSRQMDEYFTDVGVRKGHSVTVQKQRQGRIGSLMKFAQILHCAAPELDTTGLVHTPTGIVDLRGDEPVLLPHSPDYPFKFTSGITFDPSATAPRFEAELLNPALNPDDQRLLQMLLGAVLIGPNAAQKILLIRGTPGGGKGTLMTVVEKVLCEQLVAYLRTKHLNEKFEYSGFLGKRLLVGKDVPGDTLSEKGAHNLKSLTGGDLAEAEIKYNPKKPQLRGDFHVVIVSNNRLRLALDGDTGAWARRLAIVDFSRPKPERPIPNFVDLLVSQEGSGILNWLIAGAMEYRRHLRDEGTIPLTPVQQGRVDELLRGSDSVAAFTELCLVADAGRDVAVSELVTAYHAMCKARDWESVGLHKFQKQLPDVMMAKFNAARRHDILRDGKPVRGFKGVRLEVPQ